MKTKQISVELFGHLFGDMKRLALTALLLLCATAWAGPFEDGLTAYERKDYAEAVKWYRLAAAQGDADAQYNLGVMYDNGQGVVQDYAEAVKWYRLAAAQGDADAQYNLGVMYDNGQGVVQDYTEAVKWYRLAAAQGNAKAQSNLGVMYGRGQGVIQDYVRAHMWFNLAAVKGNADAVKNRNIVAKSMTPQKIEEAQKLARECQARNFKGCN